MDKGQPVLDKVERTSLMIIAMALVFGLAILAFILGMMMAQEQHTRTRDNFDSVQEGFWVW